MSSIVSIPASTLATAVGGTTAANGPSALQRAEAAGTTPTTPSTIVTLDRSASDIQSLVYGRPAALDAGLQAASPARVWAAPAQDTISARMARNGNLGTHTLAEQWRGLGGALLSRLAATQTDYQQAMADGVATDSTGAVDHRKALSDVLNGATKVSLKIQTRSGQTVELTIVVNSGTGGGNRGLQVAVTHSGPLSDTERDALARLADGFDKALEGLGQAGTPTLDLTGLMAFDTTALASLDLKVDNPGPRQALSSFTLHLGADRKQIALKGQAGEMALRLDTGTPLGAAGTQQRQAAIAQYLQQFDAAAQRSHADAALVAQFKDAFAQLHSAPTDKTAAQADGLSPPLASRVLPLLSGLADFEASFGGDFEKPNARGAVHEIGRVDYQVSQKTGTQRGGAAGAAGAVTITQTQSATLDAHYLQSRHGGQLQVASGNYDLTKIHDQSTRTTLIETARDLLLGAVQTTDRQQRLRYERLEGHRTVDAHETPGHQSFSQRLL